MPRSQGARKPQAPSSRIYNSEPNLHQKRFPPRKRTHIPSTRMSTFGAAQTQSTLTQIDFAVVMPDSDEENSGSAYVSSDEERGQGRSRKRRKIDNEEERYKRQSTLTQIGFVQPALYFDEVEDSEEEGSEIGDEMSHVEHEADENTGPELKEEEVVKREPLESIAPHTLNQISQRSPSLNHNTQTPALERPQQEPVFKTPDKPIRREVPSSQSPSESPLTPYNISPSRTQRTPLQEIPLNVIAMRDSSPRCKIKTESPIIGDSDGELDNDLDDDQENHHPSPNKSIKKSPTESRSGYKKPRNSIAGMLGNSPRFKQPNFTPTTVRVAQNESALDPTEQESTKLRSSQATTVDLTQATPTKHWTGLPANLNNNNQPQNLSYPFPSLDEDSQFPIFNDELGNCSPLSSVQNSQDIITVSQLLPASMLDE